MLAVVVSNADERAKAERDAAARGLRLSDVGTFNLPPGKLRLTFLPAKAFTDGAQNKKGAP